MLHSLAIIMCVLLALLVPSAVGAQQSTTLAVVPASQTVGLADGTFDVRVTVDDVVIPNGLGGYTFVMTYDPAVVSGIEIIDAGFFKGTQNAVICPASTGIDNQTGRLAQFCFTIPFFAESGPQTSEPRDLLSVRFEPVAEGTTTLGIGESMLSDPQGNTLIASTTDGQVTVEEGSVAPQTPGGGAEAPNGEAAEGAQPAVGAETGAGLPATGTGQAGGSDGLGFAMAAALAGSGAMALFGAGWIRRKASVGTNREVFRR